MKTKSIIAVLTFGALALLSAATGETQTSAGKEPVKFSKSASKGDSLICGRTKTKRKSIHNGGRRSGKG